MGDPSPSMWTDPFKSMVGLACQDGNDCQEFLKIFFETIFSRLSEKKRFNLQVDLEIHTIPNGNSQRTPKAVKNPLS